MNENIRKTIRDAGLYHYEVAQAIGMTPQRFSNMIVRTEMDDADTNRVLDAVARLTLRREHTEGFSYQEIGQIIADYIESANDRLDDAARNGTDHDQMYWAAYIDGIKGLRLAINKAKKGQTAKA